MKPVIQSEAAECGLACLTMIANFYGDRRSLSEIRSLFPITLRGMSLKDLINTATHFDLQTRAIRVELEGLKYLKAPSIVHWNMNHFVVLEKVDKDFLHILDPAIGRKKITFEEASSCFTGIVLEIEPSTSFKKHPKTNSWDIKSFIKESRGINSALVQFLLLSIVVQLISLFIPYYIQLVVDDVLVTFDHKLLITIALSFTCLVVFATFFNLLRGYSILLISNQLNSQLSTNFFRHLLTLPISYFGKRHMGDIVSRFDSIQQIKTSLSESVVEALIDGVLAITTLVLIYIYSPKLTLIVVATIAIYVFVRVLSYPRLRNHTNDALSEHAKEKSIFMECARGIQTIKLFGIEELRTSVWKNRYVSAIEYEYKIGKLNVNYVMFNKLLFGLENILVIYVGASMIIGAEQTGFSVGMLMAFIAYKTQLTERFTKLVDNVTDLKMLSVHIERLDDIALTQSEQGMNGSLSFDSFERFTLKNLSFRFSLTDPLLFNDVSLDIKKGQCVAIVGESGVGKSSLLKLMLGLLEPTSGDIEIDSKSIKEYGKREFRKNIACVMQDDKLLSGTIAENISMYDSEIDMEKVFEVARIAQIHESIMHFPMKYNSLIGDMGSNLSGGQQQRILLARALYCNPKILFLDEATSHLDLKCENNFNSELSKLDVTKIIVAHRLETILSADKIYRLSADGLEEVTDEYKSTKNINES